MIRNAIKSLSIAQWGIVFIGIVMIIISSNIRWAKADYWKSTIASDGRGYYAYLPAIFIYQDLNFSFFEKLDRGKYFDEHTFYEYRMPYKGKTIDKYYCGTAVAQLPFFLAAHTITKINHGDADGYSKWYQIFIGIAAIFWLLVGLIYLDKTLNLYEINPLHRLPVLLACVFGTHAFYYTLVEPAMSHIYSFAFISIFIYLSKKYFENYKGKYLLYLAIVFGLIVITRPINGLVIFILPFLAGDLIVLKDGIYNLFKKPAVLILASFIFLLILGIQSVIYKFSVGEFWIYSYQNEGFDFSNPHIIDILFSYKKGLFLYTPLLFISLIGLFFIWKKSKFQAIVFFLFFLFITYVLSSWWQWYYGGSFSGRVYLEYVPLFMILLAVALQEMHFGWRKNILVLVIFLLVVVCQIQTYQYRYYQIHWSEMTKEKYWDVFLQPN